MPTPRPAPVSSPTTSLTPESLASAHAAPERRTAVLLVAELRNFHAMVDLLPPFEAHAASGRFFDLVADAVRAASGEALLAHNGCVVAAFHRQLPQHAARQAVRAAQAIQLGFGRLAEEWKSRFGVQSASSMGLHLGDAVFVEGGADPARAPAVYGDAVTVAEGLARRARAGEFVLSDSVMGALVLANLDLDVEPLPPFRMAHHHEIRIFGVLLDTRLDFTAAPRTESSAADSVKTVPTALMRS